MFGSPKGKCTLCNSNSGLESPIIKPKGLVVFVEAMSSKVILMMPKNQELSKFQRFKNQVSRIKFQESRSRFKTQDSRIKRRLNQDKY